MLKQARARRGEPDVRRRKAAYARKDPAVEELSGGCGVAKALAPNARRVTFDWSELLDEVERGHTVRIIRRGKTIARVVPEAHGCTAEIAEAIERLKALREKTRKAPLAEILASRRGGHKY